MQRLDEVVRRLVEGARTRVVTEQDCVAGNDNDPAADEAKDAPAQKRRNRRRRRKAG